jgi:hypothetical protein
MLKINTLVVLQVRRARHNGFLSPRYFVARKVGDMVTIGLIGRAHSETIHAVLTTDGLRRLEEAIHLVRTMGRDVQIGIVPRREEDARRVPRRRPRR